MALSEHLAAVLRLLEGTNQRHTKTVMQVYLELTALFPDLEAEDDDAAMAFILSLKDEGYVVIRDDPKHHNTQYIYIGPLGLANLARAKAMAA